MGDGGVTTPFLTSGLDGGEWSDYALAALPLGKELLVPLDRRLGGPHSQSVRCGEEKILPPNILWRNHPMQELLKFRNLKECDCTTVAERCHVLPLLPSPLFALRVARLHSNYWVAQQ
jgi:hypothetical protein